MSVDTRKRTVSYRRATWANREYYPNDLQTYLRNAITNCPTTESRTVSYGEYDAQGTHFEEKTIKLHNGEEKTAILLHIVKYEPGGQANSVHKPSPEQVVGGVDAEDPPEDKDWIDGDVFVLISENHVLTCASNVRDTVGFKFITSLLDITGNDLSEHIAFDKAGNANKLQIIHREGVSRIELNADLYEATLGWFNSSVKKGLFGGIVSSISAFFSNDDDHSSIEANENVSAKVILNFDSRKKGGELGLDRMSKMGVNLIQEESQSDYTIVTRQGKRISLNEIQLKQDLDIKKHGKTVDRDDAWLKLCEYYKDLERDGLTMQ